MNASEFGFSPTASGLENARALQRAVDQGGTIAVSLPGIYNMAATVYVGSFTALQFGKGVFLKKVNETGDFCHVLLNKGALSKTFDTDIEITGLNIIVNGVDCRKYEVYGLHGQLAFFYAKDIRVDRFRCLDLGAKQYGIQVCTFEDLIIEDVFIEGKKDGVHLGRGKRFTIRNGVFRTFDDAIALNGHDYAVGNPELGWIENGVVENCHDLPEENTTGFFCRILAGGWIEWEPGMDVQQSDSVVSNGRVYRVQAEPDGQLYRSLTQPVHEEGSATLDGISWGMVQEDAVYTAGVRNVTFRDIFLGKARTAFSIHFDNDKYSRSYYPNAPVPMQEQIVFDNIRITHDQPTELLSINTPVDVVRFLNSSIRNNSICFKSNNAMCNYLRSQITFQNCVFCHTGMMTLIRNEVNGKQIRVKTVASMEEAEGFSACIEGDQTGVVIDSDLSGLKPE